MQYKTIVLELIIEQKTLHRRLRQAHRLLPTLELIARALRTRHHHWIKSLTQKDPPELAMASQAMELAIKELAGLLSAVSLPDEANPEVLDRIMATLATAIVQA